MKNKKANITLVIRAQRDEWQLYNGFPPINSDHLLTSPGIFPFSTGNFSLRHWAKSTAVYPIIVIVRPNT